MCRRLGTLIGPRRAALACLWLGRLAGIRVETLRRLLLSATPPGPPSPAARKQLLVDVSSISRRDVGTGIQRVVREILGVLLANPPGDYDVRPVYATRWRGYRHARHYRAGFGEPQTGSGPAGSVRVGADDIFLGLDLAPLPLSRNHVQLGRWRIQGVRFFFVVYDLLPVLHPEWFTRKTSRLHHEWLKTVSIFADGAICISKSVSEELKQWLGGHYGRHFAESIPAAWFHLGADFSVPASPAAVMAVTPVAPVNTSGRPSVLMVGTVEPRKGHAQVLSAFEALWREGRDIALVIAGRIGWNVDALVARLRNHPEAGSRLFWLEGAPDRTLANLYASADGVLVASEGEGFGLPIVEAARYGKPLLVRDLPVFREVAGDHASYFSTTTPAGLASVIDAWIDLVRTGRAPASGNIRQLTWAQSAGQFTRHLNDMIRNARDGVRP